MDSSDKLLFITQNTCNVIYDTDSAEETYLDMCSEFNFNEYDGVNTKTYEQVVEDISDAELTQAVEEIEQSWAQPAKNKA